jgi:hypothetical protein
MQEILFNGEAHIGKRKAMNVKDAGFEGSGN